MTTLIQRQEACLARLHEPRTSEKRAKRNRTAALNEFRRQLIVAGYGLIAVKQILQDVWDLYVLQRDAEE